MGQRSGLKCLRIVPTVPFRPRMTDPTPPATDPHSLLSLGFLAALLALGGLSLGTLTAPTRIITGLPDGPPFERVHAALWDRLRVETGALRLESALLGKDGEPDSALAAASLGAVLAAIRERPGDPRGRVSFRLARDSNCRHWPSVVRIHSDSRLLQPKSHFYTSRTFGVYTTEGMELL